MKKWMSFTGEHMSVEQLTDNAILVKDISFIMGTDSEGNETKMWHDDIILKDELGEYDVYSVSQDDKQINFYGRFESIKDYLGY